MLAPDELEIAKNAPPNGCSPAEAQSYTRWLATHHYENFAVVSWLLPKSLHQHFYNVYAYCRWADDLGDEIPNTDRALELLNWWESELHHCYDGRPSHPVFVALRETVLAKEIPEQPFADLLKAFRQDQVVKRYHNWQSMIDYCANSANPVGRLVLYLCSYRDEHRQRLSDATCTALQLANFWQDVSRDLEKGRIYIPLDVAAQHGVSESDILMRRFNDGYVHLMKDLICRTRELFTVGAELPKLVDGRLSVDLDMFSRGGQAILDGIEAMGYDTLHVRPVVTKGKQVQLLAQALLSKLRFPATPGNGSDFVGAQHAAPQTPSPKPLGTTAEERVAESYEACNYIAKASNSNFYYAFYLLPRSKRNALAALYAFNRLVDDVADEGAQLPAKQHGLAMWRAELDKAVAGSDKRFDGNAALAVHNSVSAEAAAVLPALADTLERYKIPTRYLHDLISGAEMDLTIQTYPTFDRLKEYCYRVAGTVGLTCTHVFGFRDSRAVDLAEKLGLAFQLTNIIRDVHEDYTLGRVYLPGEDLQKYNVSASDFGKNEATLGVRELLRFEADRAWQNYEEGAALLSLIDQDSRGALWLLVHTYSALLARIEEVDFAVFGDRVRLAKSEKMLFIAKARFARLTEENILENVIVIGGGLAGLAAGVALAEAGWQVRLYEQRPFLGGRATSYVLPSGEHVDNCQHVTLGCCTNLEDFYRRVGSSNKIKYFDRLVFVDPQGRRGEMQAGVLPAPFHMTGSFAMFAPLTLADKLSIARAMLDILKAKGHTKDLDELPAISMQTWLERRKQTKGAIERFWRVVLVSALDEELDRTDARFGVDVFWKAFLSNRTGYRMGVPTVPLADLYDGCKSAIERKGGQVTLRAPVRAINIVQGAVTGITFDNDKTESADAYVFALPHATFNELLPAEIRTSDPAFSNIAKIKDAPITGVHFWFDRQVMDDPFVTLLDTHTQWIFNKTALYGHPTEDVAAAQYLQMVISASYDLIPKTRQEIIDLVLAEVRQALPKARKAQLVKATVIKETTATFSPEPGIDQWRPSQRTGIAGMFLAGIGRPRVGPRRWKAQSAAATWLPKLSYSPSERHKGLCRKIYRTTAW